MNRTSLKRGAAAVAVAVSILGASVGVAAAQQNTPPDQAGWTAPTGQQQIAQTPGQPGQRPGRGGDQNGERPQPSQEQIQQMQQQRDAMQQQFIDALAKNLNLDSATVKAALDQTQKDMQAARVTEIQQ